MVSKIMTGKSIRGALSYNEHKVSEGKAILLAAEGYVLPPERLSFRDRLWGLENRAQLNDRTKTNCIHISLNFPPGENPDDPSLRGIASEYLDRLGFEGQPFLLYRHTDAGHPHVHIVTTNIKPDGRVIPLHNIGRDKSEKARRETEKIFGLLSAEKDRKQEAAWKPVPVAAKVVYGKSETKAAISNTVRAVVRDYKFTSLAELNAVLGGFNVGAYRGEPGTRMFENKGLTYHVLDRKGRHTGVPVKASSIYSHPTLKALEERFVENRESRKPFRMRLKTCIDKALGAGLEDLRALHAALGKENIEVLLRENGDRIYGITFIDHAAKTVFNGSDLGKEYTAARIQQRLGESGEAERKSQAAMQARIKEKLDGTDFSGGIHKALESIYGNGLRLETDESGQFLFLLPGQNAAYGLPAGPKLDGYFRANDVTPRFCEKLNEWAGTGNMQLLQGYIRRLFAEQQAASFGRITPDKKKKSKRKINW